MSPIFIAITNNVLYIFNMENYVYKYIQKERICQNAITAH